MEETDVKDREKAKRYANLRYWLTLFEFIYLFGYLLVVLLADLSNTAAAWAARFAGPGLRADALFLSAFAALTAIVMAPLDFYSGFVLEHRFGLSNQTIPGWLADQAKGLLLSVIFFVPLGLGAYWLLAETANYWWMLAALLWTVVGFIIAFLAPVVLMPLFNKFEQLDSPTLKAAIVDLAKKAGVGIGDVRQTDMSKRTKKANAYFTGLGRTKRIVLGDTLLADYTNDEILTIVGHEMGHWKLGHLWKGTITQAAGSMLGFFLADRFLRAGVLLFRLGSIDNVAGSPLIILAFMLVGLFAMPASNALSRRFERQADEFELRLVRRPQATISTFEKLARQNLADPSPHPLIEFLLYSHPSPAKRIAMAESARK